MAYIRTTQIAPFNPHLENILPKFSMTPLSDLRESREAGDNGELRRILIHPRPRLQTIIPSL
jgi:hypothetical protein